MHSDLIAKLTEAQRSTLREMASYGVRPYWFRQAACAPALVAAIANIPSNREPDAKVFGYSSRSTAKPVWQAACKRAKIKHLSFHACRHGFATAMLHAGIDPITVAKLGGWKDAKHVFATYGHAMEDDTLADRISDTPETQDSDSQSENNLISNG